MVLDVPTRQENNSWVLQHVSKQARWGLALQSSINSSSLSPPFLLARNMLLFSKVGFKALIHSPQRIVLSEEIRAENVVVL